MKSQVGRAFAWASLKRCPAGFCKACKMNSLFLIYNSFNLLYDYLRQSISSAIDFEWKFHPLQETLRASLFCRPLQPNRPVEFVAYVFKNGLSIGTGCSRNVLGNKAGDAYRQAMLSPDGSGGIVW